MNADISIFERVLQKVKIFFLKFSMEYFLAEPPRKQFLASHCQTINFRTLTMIFQYIAEVYFVITITFRRRATPARWRAALAIWRAIPA